MKRSYLLLVSCVALLLLQGCCGSPPPSYVAVVAHLLPWTSAKVDAVTVEVIHSKHGVHTRTLAWEADEQLAQGKYEVPPGDLALTLYAYDKRQRLLYFDQQQVTVERENTALVLFREIEAFVPRAQVAFLVALGLVGLLSWGLVPCYCQGIDPTLRKVGLGLGLGPTLLLGGGGVFWLLNNHYWPLPLEGHLVLALVVMIPLSFRARRAEPGLVVLPAILISALAGLLCGGWAWLHLQDLAWAGWVLAGLVGLGFFGLIEELTA